MSIYFDDHGGSCHFGPIDTVLIILVLSVFLLGGVMIGRAHGQELTPQARAAAILTNDRSDLNRTNAPTLVDASGPRAIIAPCLACDVQTRDALRIWPGWNARSSWSSIQLALLELRPFYGRYDRPTTKIVIGRLPAAKGSRRSR